MFPALSFPDADAFNGEEERTLDATKWPDHARALASLGPLPSYTALSINVVLTLLARWRGPDGSVHPGYQALPGTYPHVYFSMLTFYFGNWPHVGSTLIYPVRHDHEEGRRLTTAFNDAGLVQLSDKHFKLMRYNPKSKKWSPTRTA